ncbi:arylamine N-acetyltransferase [Streptomyces sp. ICBB 8177]|uniref:arylamine N-acetyltransferase family protein n=1 Tax=Streptomyces sp. ICBB 8177 TaxID=563922 RepID=UPI000D67C94D|nr:arylamine N-acetyltransferase [Streptomyces sp. ICBB 8177]PWI45344.1 acetyltransferase [Streptomyces sp. ICBB 8177]
MRSLTPEQTDGYLRRVGASRRESLSALHRLHQVAVPFENLSIHLGQDVVLEPGALYDKIVGARRGGFCYELNGAFALLLAALGYRVSLLSARVRGADDRFGPPFDHLALRVEEAAGGTVWLADVGFGDHSAYPLRLDERGEQSDPRGTFRIARAPDGDLDVLRDGVPQYRLETRPRELRDFGPTCWWQCTSPASHFTRSPVCTRLTGSGGRITLSGRRLVATDADGRRREEELPGDEAVLLAAYRDRFGIDLDRVPRQPA